MFERNLGTRLSEGDISISNETADSFGYLTVREISELKGKPWTWVVRQIAPLKDKLDLSEHLGILEIRVPKEVFIEIDFVHDTDIPAGDWVTTTALAQELGVDYKWINRRILNLSATGEFRVGTTGSKFHLPPEAYDELMEMRNQALRFFESGEYLNLNQLAKISGRHRLWVSNRLDNLPLNPILALDATGKAVEHYPKSVLDLLLAETGKYFDADGWLTISQLASIVEKDREWIETQLEDIGAIGEYRRFPKSGRVDLCFNQEVLVDLSICAKPYKKPGVGWYTETALVGITGKSKSWVSCRLQQLQIKPSLFMDSHGVIRKHYPPIVREKLGKMAKGWEISDVMKDQLDEDGEDEAVRFRDIFNKAGVAMTIKGFNNLGVTKEELDHWVQLGLVTRWKSGQYHFTIAGKAVARRVTETEEALRKLERLKSVLKDSLY